MSDGLVGYTGFVGSTLLRQRSFDHLYRSGNIGEIGSRRFDTVICAGAPAQKWIANREPEADAKNLRRLMECLGTIRCRRFILISTVDVFSEPLGVDEFSVVDESGLHPYGRHRRELEKFVEARWAERLIVRLPGLVGTGLRKNVLFDFLNDNNLDAIDSRSVFQFYPMANLWPDINTALEAGLRLVHLTAEPITVAEVAKLGFGREFHHVLSGVPVHYDLRSAHAAVFVPRERYQYSRRETLLAIRNYAQNEPRVLKGGAS